MKIPHKLVKSKVLAVYLKGIEGDLQGAVSDSRFATSALFVVKLTLSSTSEELSSSDDVITFFDNVILRCSSRREGRSC